MFGPSGFFLPTGSESTEQDTHDIELIHTSAEGFNELYRFCKNGRFFVYKALKNEFRGNLMYEDLLAKDFNIGFSLSHNSICQYFGKISHPKIGNCIVMEWVDGCTLEELINSGQIDRTLERKIICEICDALDYMHRKQIIHRDLKPENIMITHNGQRVKLIDFGLSDADSYGIFKAPAGTRMYASPELIAGEQIDSRSDIWSLGVIINEISERYGHVASRCMCRNIDKRYGSAAEVKAGILKEGARKARVILGWAAVVIATLAVAVMVVERGLLSIPEKWKTVQTEATDTTKHAAEYPNPIMTGTENGSETKAASTAEDIKPEAKSKADDSTDNLKAEPAAEPNALPPADNLDAAELEALFNDAAQSIL